MKEGGKERMLGERFEGGLPLREQRDMKADQRSASPEREKITSKQLMKSEFEEGEEEGSFEEEQER
jgi:hypothetical protein